MASFVEPIDRNALYHVIAERCRDCLTDTRNCRDCLMHMINGMPEINRLKAKWVYSPGAGDTGGMVCSNCRGRAGPSGYTLPHYCPHCGAKMEP